MQSEICVWYSFTFHCSYFTFLSYTFVLGCNVRGTTAVGWKLYGGWDTKSGYDLATQSQPIRSQRGIARLHGPPRQLFASWHRAPRSEGRRVLLIVEEPRPAAAAAPSFRPASLSSPFPAASCPRPLPSPTAPPPLGHDRRPLPQPHFAPAGMENPDGSSLPAFLELQRTRVLCKADAPTHVSIYSLVPTPFFCFFTS